MYLKAVAAVQSTFFQFNQNEFAIIFSENSDILCIRTNMIQNKSLIKFLERTPSSTTFQLNIQNGRFAKVNNVRLRKLNRFFNFFIELFDDNTLKVKNICSLRMCCKLLVYNNRAIHYPLNRHKSLLILNFRRR